MNYCLGRDECALSRVFLSLWHICVNLQCEHVGVTGLLVCAWWALAVASLLLKKRPLSQ